jgi:predicted acyltransferase
MIKDTNMNSRNESLDALRGLAILTMILSGSIAYGDVLPAWMFHAQVPPPLHQFNPALPGITWVDLVFPFFLFSMGAAIPLALHKHLAAGKGLGFVLLLAGKRFALLAFFALFTQHMKAWVIADNPTATAHLLSLLAFSLLFVQFYQPKQSKFKMYWTVAKALSFALALFLLWRLPFWSGKGFDFYHSDIIIMVLANMAFFGTVVYYATAKQPLLRIGLLPFIMAIFLAAKEPSDGWAKTFFNFNHIGDLKFDWLYKFYFLKYLFIIIPGTLAGEWMMRMTNDEFRMTNMEPEDTNNKSQIHPNTATPVNGQPSTVNYLMLVGLLLLLLANLYGLFTRSLLLNLLVTGLLCGGVLYQLRNIAADHLYKKLARAGTYLLLLGLFFEAYEGGIKKDSSTYSYYLVTSGLAFFTLLFFSGIAQRRYGAAVVNWLATNGKNPMVAYVAGNLLLLPLLSLTHIKPYWDALHQNAWIGLLKGLLFTGAVSVVTVFFVRRKWFWKT